MKKYSIIGVLLGAGLVAYFFFPLAPLATGDVCLRGKETGERGLVIQMTEQEFSEDANWTVEELYVNNDRLYYIWEYGGYHPNDDYERERSKRTRLDDHELEALFALAEQEPLSTSLTSEGEVVDGSHLALRFEYFDGDECVEVIVEGMKSAHFDDTVELIGHEEVIQAVKQILRYAEDEILSL
jgi:hypothetical protein